MRHRSSRRWPWAVGAWPGVVVAAAVAISACGSAGASHGSGGGGGSSGASSGGGHGRGGTLVIGMDLSAIPPLDTELAGAQGYEGNRFVSNQLFDGLTQFNLDQSTTYPGVIPDLASSWSASHNAKVWTFHLRKGVKFSDGTPWNAAAAIFNFNRAANPKSQYYYAPLSGLSAGVLGKLTWKAPNASTIVLTSKTPDAELPSGLATFYFASPTAVKKEGNRAFGERPVGTGPFTFSSETPGQQLVLTANKHYWAGAPKLDKLILKPIPDPSARLAALRSGAVNWIEYPDPDSIASLKSSGYQIPENSYDHVWPWILDTSVAPLNNLKVRQALNYAINRTAITKNLLDGTATPAYQVASTGNPAYDPANNVYSYNPTLAKKLLAQAGYPHGFKLGVLYPVSGSSMLLTQPINSELQSQLAAVGVQVKLVPTQLSTVSAALISGKYPPGVQALNWAWSFQNEPSAWLAQMDPASGLDPAHYTNKAAIAQMQRADATLNTKARDKIYARVAGLVTRGAPDMYVLSDLNPRALAPSVHGFIEPKSWFVDLKDVWVS